MAIALDALKIARSLLNDNLAITWSDATLMPLLQVAHGELLLDLRLNEIPVVQETSTTITVLAGATNLGINQPNDLVVPNRLYEKDTGAPISFYTEMSRVTVIPKADQTSALVYWAWQQELIQFLGATSDRDVLVEYVGSVITPTLVTSNLGFISSELYIGARIAALAMATVGNDGQASIFDGIAQSNLDKILRFNVKEDQDLPVRRLPYRRGTRRRIF